MPSRFAIGTAVGAVAGILLMLYAALTPQGQAHYYAFAVPGFVLFMFGFFLFVLRRG